MAHVLLLEPLQAPVDLVEVAEHLASQLGQLVAQPDQLPQP
jgi:hypothetical protein